MTSGIKKHKWCCLLFLALLSLWRLNNLQIIERRELVIEEAGRFERTYNRSTLQSTFDTEYEHEPIDAVITWVNGSDADFIKSLHRYKRKSKQLQNRFADFDQLKYVLKSIDLFAPWIRRVYLVTNGQTPSYVNQTRVQIVTHEQIFPNGSYLPTFSSCSIEVYLSRIPDLSRKFIYFNDDITLMKPTFLSDFWTAENGTKLFPKKDITPNWWTSRKECTPECKLVFQNRHCDSKCNTLRCEWDGGDCDTVKPLPNELDNRDEYHLSTAFTNIALNRHFNVTKTNRTWYPHLPIFFDQIILDDMFAAFSPEFDLTARHRLRAKNDMQIEFTYYNFIIESRANLTALNTSSIPDAYKYERVDPEEDISYITYGKFPDRNMRALNRFRKNPKKFLCINDVMDHSDKSALEQSISFMRAFYAEYFD